MYHGLQLQIKFQVHLSSPDTYTLFFCNVLMGRSTGASLTYAPGKERITCFTSATREIINYHQFASSVKAALKFKVSGVCFLFPRLHLVIWKRNYSFKHKLPFCKYPSHDFLTVLFLVRILYFSTFIVSTHLAYFPFRFNIINYSIFSWHSIVLSSFHLFGSYIISSQLLSFLQ